MYKSYKYYKYIFICISEWILPLEGWFYQKWSQIASDLFILDEATYLLVVDYFSRYPKIAKPRRTTSGDVISALHSIFKRHGVPEVMVSDNGPQYSSHEMEEFVSTYGFTHITSSPHYPQSNGLAERPVQTVKQLLKKSQDLHLALLVYRATPFPWCGSGFLQQNF